VENGIDISETGKVNLDMKTLVGIVIMIMSIATVYFSLQGKIAQLELDVIRMQDSTAMNTEFRIKWPRGELGALPDDAVQDINIQYIKEEIEDVEEKIEELEKKVEDHDRSTGH
jgi:5-bromo-4-chloroindolyl phosphate hydrolysis protein